MKVSLARRFAWRFFWFFFAIFIVPVCRIRGSGFWKLPRKGSFLMLGNHGTWMDPFWAAFFVYRRVHFMASAFFFEHWFLGPIFKMFGAFPKAKFTRDRQAIKLLVEFHRAGEVVSLFPEGERSWDGRPLPILPNIGKLILKLGTPVVFVRIIGVHHQHPRWAKYPRWTTLRLEYSEPITFPADMAPADLDREVARRLYVDPETVPPPRFAIGYKMAVGLPNYLWACPSCFVIDGLRLDQRNQNCVRCHACTAGWRIDVATILNPLTSGAEKFSLIKAYDRVLAHYGDPPVADPARYRADGVVLESDCSYTLRTARGKPEVPIHVQGRLRLTPDDVRVIDPEGNIVWHYPLRAMTAVSLEGDANLTLRLPDQVVAIDTGDESRMKWEYFMREHRGRAIAESQASQAE